VGLKPVGGSNQERNHRQLSILKPQILYYQVYNKSLFTQYSLLNNIIIDKGCATELLKIKANGYDSSGRDYGSHAGSHHNCNILNKPTFIQAYM
jgi:hypothetical protein